MIRRTSLYGASILITGGTGTLGNALARALLTSDYLGRPERLIIYSRDEMKQAEMADRLRAVDREPNPRLRFFIGDVRDVERLTRAMHGVDVVIHAAAMKQVPACEYNPTEAIATNVLGTQNVIDAALATGVGKVIATSTDKACAPRNLYGATKLCLEKLVIAANAYSGGDGTRFAVVRYGNVTGSRGSVVPVFRKAREFGIVPITNPLMTRFWIDPTSAVSFVLAALEDMHGGETFVPRLPAYLITDLAEAIAPGLPLRVIGIRPGEKLHETLISEDECGMFTEHGERWIGHNQIWHDVEPFSFRSDNADRLTVPELRRLLKAQGDEA